MNKIRIASLAFMIVVILFLGFLAFSIGEVWGGIGIISLGLTFCFVLNALAKVW